MKRSFDTLYRHGGEDAQHSDLMGDAGTLLEALFEAFLCKIGQLDALTVAVLMDYKNRILRNLQQSREIGDVLSSLNSSIENGSVVDVTKNILSNIQKFI